MKLEPGETVYLHSLATAFAADSHVVYRCNQCDFIVF